MSSARAQGQVRFFNNAQTLVSDGGQPISGPPGAYYFALLTAPAGTTDPRLFTFSGLYATNTTTAGRLQGGPGTGVQVPDWPVGTSKAFMVCGWRADMGHDWNPGWLSPIQMVGRSMTATGMAGGTDPVTGLPLPPLYLFSGATINTGFEVFGCSSPAFFGFTAQPTNQTVVLDTPAIFYVQATACPGPAYQWYFNGAAISGANNSNYQISDCRPENAGDYVAVLTGYWGSYTSMVGTLTVLLAPVIAFQPQDQTAMAGSTVHFHVGALGALPLSYQWSLNDTALAGATTSDLQLDDIQTPEAGNYTVVITNFYGAVTSSPAMLTVLPSPPVISVPPQDRTALIGSETNFSVMAIGSEPLSFQWFFNLNESIANATNSLLLLTNIQLSQSGQYSVLITNVYGAVTSSPAALTVVGLPPSIVSFPSNRRVFAGWSVDLSVSVSGSPPLAYQWMFNSSPVPQGTSATLHLANVRPSDSGQYYIAVTNSFGSAVSSPAVLTVLALPPVTRPTGTVIAWGAGAPGQAGPNDFGQSTVPANLGSAFAIDGGDFHTVAVKPDGTVAAWGDNRYGQTTIPADLSNVVAVAAGALHTLALRADGTIVAWGDNAGGQCTVPANLSNAVDIAAGTSHSLALKSDGTMVAWGTDSYGATQVPSWVNNVIAISAAASHDLALTSDGRVVGWGDNRDWESYVPTNVVAAVAIAAGGSGEAGHSLALQSDGTVAAWGAGAPYSSGPDDFGQSTVPAGLANVTAIAAGGWHSLALKSNGTVVAWGISPDSGQTAVPAELSNVVAIAAGARHSLTLVNRPLTGTNQPAAFSNFGRITINDYAPASPYPSPISVSGLAGRIAKITATIHRFSHTSPADVSMLLAGPAGQSVLLMSHAGVTSVARDVELTFDDSAPTGITGAMLSGTYKPTQVSPTPLFPSPAPAQPYGTNLAVFNNSNPNGQWNLFVLDDVFLDSGIISNGWSLTITTWGNVPTVAPPVSTTAEIGSAARLIARAGGDPPLHFQWFFNGSNAIAGRTSSILTIPNAQLSQSGPYTIRVTNVFGAVTSAPAMLQVITPVPRTQVPGLALTNMPGVEFGLEFSDSLSPLPNWTLLATVAMSASSQWYFDLTTPLPAQRFYRACQPGRSPIPTFGLHMVPALTLTGTIGSSVRVDYINQFGPTDAWVTLATATLTNTSQIYFDTTALGQPPRLYRLLPQP